MMESLAEVNIRFDFAAGKDLKTLLSVLNLGVNKYWTCIEFVAKKVGDGPVKGQFAYSDTVFEYNFDEKSSMLSFQVLYAL